MSDFVAEVRPRSFTSQPPVPVYSPQDFVAEIRPRTYHSDHRQVNRQCSPQDISDSYLQDILTGRHFSREGITQLLEQSVLTLVEKLLTGRPVSNIEGHLRIFLNSEETPITVSLAHTFPVGHNNNHDCLKDQNLETSLNVKVKGGDLLHTLGPHNEEPCSGASPFHEFDRDPCHTEPEADTQPRFLFGYTREGDSSMSSPPGDSYFSSAASPSMQEVPGHLQAPGSTLSTKLGGQRRESDEESGYTSSEREDTDSSQEPGDVRSSRTLINAFNDYYCSGFDGKSTLYTSDVSKTGDLNSGMTSRGSSGDEDDEMDDDDDEDIGGFESPLVIDEDPAQGVNKPSVVVNNEDKNSYENTEAIDMEHGPQEKTFHRRDAQKLFPGRKVNYHCAVDEAEDTDCPVSSDITDTDVPMDLSGDGRFTSDVESVPHQQTLVAKHHSGFRCTQCSHVFTNAADMSMHVQSKHSLYCCTECCRTFTAKNNLKRHMRLHTGLRPYKCSQCPQTFARRDDLKGHVLRHDYSKPFRCSLCKKGYTDRACVKNHMAKEHRSRLMHVCPQCGESFDQDETFTAHKKSHPELHQFSCSTCSFIGTNNLMTLKHGLLHSYKLFSCKPCNAYFADPFDYTDHARKHKKVSTFSQYVCCFCDLSLATYDQYIRHEYSHAQGKTHTCKVCKKQFRNKSLLLEHALTHETYALDKPQVEHRHPGPGLAVTSQNPQSRSPGTQHNHVFASDLEPHFSDDLMEHSHDHILPASVEANYSVGQENCYYAPEGELLDLSLKKSSCSTSPEDQHHFSPRSEVTGLAERSCPRNGVACSASFNLNQEREVCERGVTVYQTAESMTLGDKKHNLNSNKNRLDPQVTDQQASTRAVSNDVLGFLQLPPVYHPRPGSAERRHLTPDSDDAKFQRRQLHRANSQNAHQLPLRSTRFSPYAREKMADLAAKFVAARGTNFFGQKIPLKSLVPISDNIEPIIQKEDRQTKQAPVLAISNWNLVSSTTSKESPNHGCVAVLPVSVCQKYTMPVQIMDNDGVARANSNPETALKCHIPTFVKSENLREHVPDMKASPGCGFQNIRSDGVSNSAQVCEVCKEEFASFSELESHSIEMHKRYLCKHCMKSFTASPNRDRHVRYHTGERPYRCDLCDLAFFRGDDLKYHRTTRHPTAPPYTCTRCSATFTWGRDLERHIRHSKCPA